MSSLRVKQLLNADANGPVEFSTGIEIPSSNNIIYGNLNVGVVTATSFSGVGSGITFATAVEISKVIALTLIG